jgi:hypothetical protein
MGALIEKWTAILHKPLSLITAASVGALIVLWHPILFGWLTRAFDDAFPVLVMEGELVGREGDSVQVHIVGEKYRGTECVLIRIYGYAVSKDGTMHNAVTTRIDVPASGIIRPAGKYDIGIWSVRPVHEGAARVRVYTDHDCVGRVIRTMIVDVPLTP